MDTQNMLNSYQNLTQDELNTRLISAAGQGNNNEVQALLETKVDVNATNNDGHTALMFAARYGYTAIVNALILANANVNAADNDAWTALMFASRYGYTAIINALTLANANVSATDNDGWTALMFAANNGHTATVNSLIQQGANVNTTDNHDKTALMHAASHSYAVTKLIWIASNDHTHTAYRLLSQMTLAERLIFSTITVENSILVTQFNQELKKNANKLYNMMMPSLTICPDSILAVCPPELINYIKILETLVQDFPDWYQHRIESDLNLTIEFCLNHKKMPPIIFSENAPGSKKRKAEDVLEGPPGKKLKTGDDRDDDMETELNSYYYPCSIQ